MILAVQCIKILKLISFPLSKSSLNRITVFCLNTIFGSMVRLKNQFKGVMAEQFLRILSALYVVLLINTFTTNNVGKGQFQCKICGQTFTIKLATSAPLVLVCPYCGHTLVAVKDRKHFIVHKCSNKKCSYYKNNLKLLPKDLDPKEKYKYKLHYIYRNSTLDFFSMDLNQLPSWLQAVFKRTTLILWGFVLLTMLILVYLFEKLLKLCVNP